MTYLFENFAKEIARYKNLSTVDVFNRWVMTLTKEECDFVCGKEILFLEMGDVVNV